MKKLLFIFILFSASAPLKAQEKREPLVIALHADMTSGSALAGKAIQRGAQIAIEELNGKGGVLGGRKFKLFVKDHHGVPTRAAEEFPELVREKNLVAVLGGLHSPAIIQCLPAIHQNKVILLDPWAAATSVIDNGYNPNYVFRVSVRDEYVGEFLVQKAVQRGYKKLGLLLERTGWGRSNEKAMNEALAKRNLEPADTQWFQWGDLEMTAQISSLEAKGADAILMVANAPEGSVIIKNVAQRPEGKRLPIFSHWGITGGDFFKKAGDDLKKVRLYVLQTYSFLNPPNERAQNVARRYHALFKTKNDRQIVAPVGTAHAYDLVHLLALAVEKAQSADRSKVRDALEQIESYSGLMKDYRPPFTETGHEGLDAGDYCIAVFESDGALVPIP